MHESRSSPYPTPTTRAPAPTLVARSLPTRLPYERERTSLDVDPVAPRRYACVRRRRWRSPTASCLSIRSPRVLACSCRASRRHSGSRFWVVRRRRLPRRRLRRRARRRARRARSPRRPVALRLSPRRPRRLWPPPLSVRPQRRRPSPAEPRLVRRWRWVLLSGWVWLAAPLRQCPPCVRPSHRSSRSKASAPRPSRHGSRMGMASASQSPSRRQPRPWLGRPSSRRARRRAWRLARRPRTPPVARRRQRQALSRPPALQQQRPWLLNRRHRW